MKKYHASIVTAALILMIYLVVDSGWTSSLVVFVLFLKDKSHRWIILIYLDEYKEQTWNSFLR